MENLNTNEMTEGQEFYRCYVYVKGIRKRCRKVEFKGFSLANVTIENKDKPESIEAMKAAARLRLDKEMKSIEGTPYLSFSYAQCSGDFIYDHPFHDLNFKIPLEEVCWD